MMMMAPIDLLCLALAVASSAAAVASSPSSSLSYFVDRFSVSAAAAAATTTTRTRAVHDRVAFVGTAAAGRRVGTAAADADDDDDVVGRRRPERRRRSFAKRGDGDYGESDGEKKKKKRRSQRELLLDLESKFDYEGRISSKTSSAGSAESSSSDDGDDDALSSSSSSSSPPPHRCALLTILGRPNMGKSTLLNALLSDDLAVATNRPQTTRHAILGVLTADAVQLCVTDTPGIIPDPAYRLQVGMMDAVRGAVRSADIFLVVTDVYSGVPRPITNKEGKRAEEGGEKMMEEPDEFLGLGEEMLSKLRLYEKPVIVCVNKVDLAADDEGGSVYANAPAMAVSTMTRWREALPDAFAIIPTCAADGPDDPGVVALRSMLLANDPDVDVGDAVRGLGRPVPGMFGGSGSGATSDTSSSSVGERAREMVPIGPPLYHPDFFTDRTDRFCASEIVRGALFRGLGKELPYCCEVRIESFDESSRWIDDDDDDDSPSPPLDDKKKKKKKPMIRMAANILVERDSQKGIVVGKGGTKIREVGTEARRELQEFFGCKVFLELRVKVDKNWRNDDDKLKKYGYMS